MNIAAPELKALLKKVSAARGDLLTFDTVSGTISAEDNDLRISVQADVLKEQPGAIMQVNARKLTATLSRLSGLVTLDVGKAGLKVKSAKSEFALEAKAAKAPEPLPAADDTHLLLLAPLKTVLKVAATATQKGHAGFNDVVELQGSELGPLEARGTNELRLVTTATSIGVSRGGFTLLVPTAAISALGELTADEVVLSVSPGVLLFQEETEASRVSIAARRPVKTFPDWSKIIPTAFETTVKVDAGTAREALKRIAPFVASDDLRAISLKFFPTEIELIAKDGGTAKDYIPILDGGDLDVDPFADTVSPATSMNHAYLSDFFEAAQGEVVIGLNPGGKPLWLTNGDLKALITCLVTAKA